jgi:hypothetical protein
MIDMYMAQQERCVQLGIYEPMLTSGSAGTETHRQTLRMALGDKELRNRLAAHAVAIDGLLEELAAVGLRIEGMPSSLGAELERH